MEDAIMKRIPFHFGLFYHAMLGLVGRTPDTNVCHGFDGVYNFWYVPRDEAEEESFRKHAVTLAEWLDHFEIVFSESRCEYGMVSIRREGLEMLQITIRVPK